MMRLKNIEENYNKSLKAIQAYLNNVGEPEMVAITKLLLDTDVNPHGFLPHHFANGFNTASGFNSLLHNIHHALYDDGEISFPIINGEPRIIFVNKFEDNYEDYALNDTEKYFKNERGNTYDIQQCADVYDFIRQFELYNTKEVRRWFVTDAARFGIDFAVKHHCKYAQFSPDWEFDEDVLAEIQSIYDKYVKAGLLKGSKND